VLAAELRAAAADSIVVRGDTAIDLLTGVALSVVCASAAREVVLPSDQSTAVRPFTLLRSTPAAGDLLAVFDTSAGWRTVLIDSVQQRSDGAGCATTTGFRTAADSAARRKVYRLLLADSIGVVVGAPARLFRRGRYALVRGGDGAWGLAWRRCDAPAPCGPSQPVAGPLAPPTDTGFRARLDADGAAIRLQLTAADTAPTRRRLTFTVALRGNHAPP